jgi:hypothetical protein
MGNIYSFHIAHRGPTVSNVHCLFCQTIYTRTKLKYCLLSVLSALDNCFLWRPGCGCRLIPAWLSVVGSTVCGVGNQMSPVLSWKVGGGVCWGQSPNGSTSDNLCAGVVPAAQFTLWRWGSEELREPLAWSCVDGLDFFVLKLPALRCTGLVFLGLLYAARVCYCYAV